MKKFITASLVCLVVLVTMLATPLRRALFRRAADLHIIFTADVEGRIEPCGCFEGQPFAIY